jgi:hypothetical protein
VARTADLRSDALYFVGLAKRRCRRPSVSTMKMTPIQQGQGARSEGRTYHWVPWFRAKQGLPRTEH